MVSYCCVLFCKSKGSDPGTDFFTLTKKRYNSWMKALGRSGKLSHSNVVCSKHFTSNDFYLVDGRIRLKPDAIPNLNIGPHKPPTALDSPSSTRSSRDKKLACGKDILNCKRIYEKVNLERLERQYSPRSEKKVLPDAIPTNNCLYDFFGGSNFSETLAGTESYNKATQKYNDINKVNVKQGIESIVPQYLVTELEPPPLILIERGRTTSIQQPLPSETSYNSDLVLPPLVPIRGRYQSRLPLTDPPPLVPIEPVLKKFKTTCLAGVKLEDYFSSTIKTEETKLEWTNVDEEEFDSSTETDNYRTAYELDGIKEESLEVDEKGNIQLIIDNGNDELEYVWIKTEPFEAPPEPS